MTTDAVPFLRFGTGETPAEGGCVLQVADWIYRREWTDKPPCVHPVLRAFAIAVNDRLPDDERQHLLDLIPRLLNTNTGDEALTRKLLAYLARQVYPVYAKWAEGAGYDDGGAVLNCIEAAERGEAAAEAAGALDAVWASDAASALDAAGASDAAWAAWAARAAQAAQAADAASAARASDAAVAARDAVRGAAAAPRAAWAARAADLLSMLSGLLDHYDALTGRTKVEAVDYAQVVEVMATTGRATTAGHA